MSNDTIYIGFNENFEMVASHRYEAIDCPLDSVINIDVTPDELKAIKAGLALAVYCPLRGWRSEIVIAKDEAQREGMVWGASVITADDNEPATLDSVRFIE